MFQRCRICESNRSGACIIKLITAVIYGFRNKLECLFMASLLTQFSVQGQTLQLITETVDILGEIEEDATDAVSEKCRTGATDDQLKGTT